MQLPTKLPHLTNGFFPPLFRRGIQTRFLSCQKIQKLSVLFLQNPVIKRHPVGEKDRHGVSVGHMTDAAQRMTNGVDHSHHTVGKSRPAIMEALAIASLALSSFPFLDGLFQILGDQADGSQRIASLIGFFCRQV